jgi:radical SAM protein (TIGR04043 family)
MTELQTRGLRLTIHRRRRQPPRRRRPSDHKAVTVDGVTLMVPVHPAAPSTRPSWPGAGADGAQRILRHGVPIADRVRFRASRASTDADGRRHSLRQHRHAARRDVLATTVLQTCIRYESRRKACQFCAIGQSLAAGRTIARKTPEQLAEVARAAVLLDGVKHMVMTTGTPPRHRPRRPAAVRERPAVKAAVNLPIQGQCEPPDDDAWFQPHARRRHRHPGHAPGGGGPEVRKQHHAGQGQRAGGAIWTPSPPRSRCSGAARSAPTSWPGWATTRPSWA